MSTFNVQPGRGGILGGGFLPSSRCFVVQAGSRAPHSRRPQARQAQVTVYPGLVVETTTTQVSDHTA